ncbi:hypothetical protein KEM48_010926 [Puccinia striiformis f. sp. tritici PST-130]|nr:hypothetical protein KEM48_010926 [Puccinia striiformis f. sp. tritici PST-130]
MNGSTHSNLKTHCDGAINCNRVRKACPGQGKVVTKGTNLPISSDDKAAAKEKQAAQFGDYLLGVVFDFSDAHTKVFSWTRAALNARKLYMSLQFKVILDIKKSGSKIGLITNVCTTKGNHKAYIRILVCYIKKKWEYISQHLSLSINHGLRQQQLHHGERMA